MIKPIPNYDELWCGPSPFDREEDINQDECDDYGCMKAEAEQEEDDDEPL